MSRPGRPGRRDGTQPRHNEPPGGRHAAEAAQDGRKGPSATSDTSPSPGRATDPDAPRHGTSRAVRRRRRAARGGEQLALELTGEVVAHRHAPPAENPRSEDPPEETPELGSAVLETVAVLAEIMLAHRRRQQAIMDG